MKTRVEFEHRLRDGMLRSLDFFDFGNAATRRMQGLSFGSSATRQMLRVCRFAPRHFGRFAFIG